MLLHLFFLYDFLSLPLQPKDRFHIHRFLLSENCLLDKTGQTGDLNLPVGVIHIHFELPQPTPRRMGIPTGLRPIPTRSAHGCSNREQTLFQECLCMLA